MITAYEIIKSLEKEKVDKLVEVGVLSSNLERDMATYETFCFLRSQDVPIMLCYDELASMYFTNSETIRKIVAKLGK